MALILENIKILDPNFIILIILPPLLIFIDRKNKYTEYFITPNLHTLSKFYKNKKNKLNFKKFIFFYFIYILLNIALTNPNIISYDNKAQHHGYDLMLVLDLSNSMAALDFSTKEALITRLDISKKEVKKFIESRKNDRIGIIIFGKYAYLETPLTIDHLSLNSIIDELEIGMTGQETAIGDALTLALDKLGNNKEQSQAIILITDGENTAGYINPLMAATLAKEKNIPIFTIGIGGNGEAPFLDNMGQLQYANIPLDIKTLNEISKISQGIFYNAKSNDELEKIYTEINKLIKTEKTEINLVNLQPIYHYFILIALSLLFSYVIIILLLNINARKFSL